MSEKLNLPEDEIINMYHAGLTIMQIGKKFNCNFVTIYNRLKNNNINTSKRYLTNKINENFFDELNEASAYWLGFFVADGNIYKNQISIALANKDLEHLKLLNKLIGSTHKIQYRKDKPNCRFHITNTHIREKLNNLGITANKTYTVKYPDIPSKLNQHFIRGVFDGDGSAHIDKRHNSLVIDFNGNKYILEQINNIIKKELGITKKNLHMVKSSQETLRLRYGGGKEAKKVHNWMYNNSEYYLDRKREVINNVK